MVKSRRTTTSLLSVLALVLVVLSLALGPVWLSVAQLLRGLVGTDPVSAIIIWDIRLPRTILATLTGFTLGLSGAALQGLIRNPLAEPTILGTPQAAGLGAVGMIVLGSSSVLSPMVPLAAISAALANLAMIFWLVGKNKSVATLLLAGVGIGSISAALVALLLTLSSNPYAVMEIVFWLMGSFEDRSFQHVLLATPFMLAGTAIIFACRTRYDGLALGDDVAQTLGINVARLARMTAAGVSLAVGASVAVCGAIGFVGFIAPHLVRPFVPAAPSESLLPSSLAGVCLILTADIAVRLIPSVTEIRIGVVTALIGAPLFILVLLRRINASSGLHHG